MPDRGAQIAQITDGARIDGMKGALSTFRQRRSRRSYHNSPLGTLLHASASPAPNATRSEICKKMRSPGALIRHTFDVLRSAPPQIVQDVHFGLLPAGNVTS